MKWTGLAIPKISAPPSLTGRLLTLMPSFIAFNIYYLGFETPDAKNPHISDEDSLCWQVDGTCHSENQRAPQPDRPTIDTYAIIYRI
ncbi:hypothetical protein GLP10_03800 [Photobacterium iliopiscarium]|uniref:hypothetical protein n=1 Tax=Photobacterium iliopiscarium TaxID=56192 RepID=UPI001E58AB46|nr:hypothetical protein [Photobacterium iliopiscarium]MCD9486261.1 hypothetical protein [Photobacterium iliopiscarium]